MKCVDVNGYDELQAAVKSADSDKNPLFVLFSGEKTADGQSWCPDCVKAAPIVDKSLATTLKDVDGTFVRCNVGKRDEWKDQSNRFRTDPALKLTGVPTLIDWHQKSRRLVEEQLFNSDLIEMLFTDAIS